MSNDDRPSKDGRGMELVAIARLAAVALIVVAALAVAIHGGFTPGLDLRGGAHMDIALVGANGAHPGEDATRARELVADRLAVAGITDASVLVRDDRLQIEIGDPAPDTIERLRSSVLYDAPVVQLLTVDDAWTPSSIPAGLHVERVSLEHGAETFLVATGPGARERLASALAALPAPAGERLAVGPYDPGGWRSYALVAEGGVTGDHLRDAKVVVDELGRPCVAVEYDARGTELLAALTARDVGHAMAIVVDDEVNWAPRVQTPITGGRLQITMGGAANDQGSALEKAKTLAAALQAGALPGKLVVENEIVIPAAVDADTRMRWLAFAGAAWLALIASATCRFRAAGAVWSLLGPAASATVAFALLARLDGTLAMPFCKAVAASAALTWVTGIAHLEMARRGKGAGAAWLALLAGPVSMAVLGLAFFALARGVTLAYATGVLLGSAGALVACVLAAPVLARPGRLPPLVRDEPAAATFTRAGISRPPNEPKA